MNLTQVIHSIGGGKGGPIVDISCVGGQQKVVERRLSCRLDWGLCRLDRINKKKRFQLKPKRKKRAWKKLIKGRETWKIKQE